MLSECIYGECAHEQHVSRTLTLTLTHTITAYSVSGNVVRVRILICVTKQKPCRKSVYPFPVADRNSLPSNVRSAPTLTVFRKRLQS